MTGNRSRRVLTILVAAFLFALTFGYRFASMGGHFAGFEDDEFVHLSQAQQLLLGQRPTRDFVELGMPMTVALSAAAQVAGGRTLLSEAVLTMGMLGLCTAVLFVLAARASGSITIALLIALVQIAMAPRFYNYPKLLAYALAVPAIWIYLDRPTRPRAAIVGVAAAAAFLLRHDHGVYVGFAALLAVVVAQWPNVRHSLRDAVVALTASFLCTAPYLAITQFDGGVVSHVRDFVSFAVRASGQTNLNSVGFEIDTSQPLWTRKPEPETVRRIHVEWQANLASDTRAAAERDHGLTEAEPFSEKVWVYRVTDASPARIEAIVKDARVVDTDGIDRSRFTLSEPPAPQLSASERVMTRLWKLQLLPGLLREANAAPYLYYLFTGIPAVALVLALLGWRTGAASQPTRGAVIVLAILTIVVNAALLRGNLPSRLADVTELVGVLGAWVAGALMTNAWRRVRPLVAGVLALVLMFAALSAQALEGVTAQISQTRILEGGAQTAATVRGLHALMSATPPIDAWGPEVSGIERVAHYIRSCTTPSDRVLVVSYAPWVYFMSGRGFAGGHVWLQARYFSTPEDQALMIKRLQQERPPIVLTIAAPKYSEYMDSFPLLDAFLSERYTLIGPVDFGDNVIYRVLTARDLTPQGEYSPLGLPCFAATASR